MKNIISIAALSLLAACSSQSVQEDQTRELQFSESSAGSGNMLFPEATGPNHVFERQASEVKLADYTVWYGQDIEDPESTPTTGYIEGKPDDFPSYKKVAPEGWDEAALYRGISIREDGSRFPITHFYELEREFDNEAEAIAFYKKTSSDVSTRFQDMEYEASGDDGAHATWRLNDPKIDFPRLLVAVERQGKSVTARHFVYLGNEPFIIG